MKKLLALILSVIMVLSIMPMAFAKRAEYSPEIEEYIDNATKVTAILNYSLYESREQHIEVYEMLMEVIDNLDMIDFSYDTLINIEVEGRLDEIIALNECLNKVFAEIDKKISDGKMTCVMDGYELVRIYYYLSSHYSLKEIHDLGDRAEIFNSEKYTNTITEAQLAVKQIEKMLNERTGTQAEFDAALAMVKPLYDSVFACLDGDHPYGEYISDNNATEDADGTKTATCEFCGATDRIVDEGTKLPKEEASFYEKLFDLIKDFIALILTMFK